jgi:hypothetical protein
MNARNPWFGLSMKAWALAVDASVVIGLRTMKIAAGGKLAEAETRLMVNEKIEAGAALGAMAMAGKLGVSPESAAGRTIAHYHRKVRANRRRLTRGK